MKQGANKITQVTGNRNKIEIAFLQRLPYDLLYGCDRDYFHKDEVLWRFERENSDLNTVWLAGKLLHPILSDSEGEITTKSFEKVVDEEHR